MTRRAHGQVRRSQVITTWGPGALIDLPRHAGIVGGLDSWPKTTYLDQIDEPRLSRKLTAMTGVPAPPLFAPPADTSDPSEPKRGIRVWQFPRWFIVQDEGKGGEGEGQSRRLVHRKALDEKGRFDGLAVTPTRFVRACPRGHVDDIDWHRFAHGTDEPCTPKRQLWLDERGTGGDLADLVVRCDCGKRRSLHEASEIESRALGPCYGERPWLGRNAEEECDQPSRLLIRTAANAYFPQIVSVLSLPEGMTGLRSVIADLWDDLQIVDDANDLALMKKKHQVAQGLAPFSDAEVLGAIAERKHGEGVEKPVKQVELDALLAVPEGYGDDVPIDPNFHARRIPGLTWEHSELRDRVAVVVQAHRLREVLALAGFTRFEAVAPDINGEYEGDVERADLAMEPSWFPAVENRGEGVFLQLDGRAVSDWLARPAVKARVDKLVAGHERWAAERKSKRVFPGAPYVLLHTLAHLLMQSVAMRCGYPATSIRERIYSDPAGSRYGLLLYTASPDAEGTLGGLVQQARELESHLVAALDGGGLCSNDPICAQHDPDEAMEGRWLHGAACHGCSLVSETSCEMRNDYLDRALVIPTLDVRDAAFFQALG